MTNSLRASLSIGFVSFALASRCGAAQSEHGSGVTPSAPSPQTPRALFVQLCAACHGERGDGKGTTALEKPARSFLSGGFSYGNTPEALLRTITFGIPGTPMPSFASALGEAQRKALAEFVRAFAPPVDDVARAETLLLVRDTPLFARGKLAPIADGAPETVRGLLAGTLDGSTFEWRVDDVRLLGVRRGEFVERRDWTGRGGDALLPLGKLVHVRAGGRPGPAFALHAGEASVPLLARLRATRAVSGDAHLVYQLAPSGAGARCVAEVDETLAAASAGALNGYARRAELSAPEGGGGEFVWNVAESAGAELVEHGPRWALRRGADGTLELTWLRAAPADARLDARAERVSVGARVAPSARVVLDAVTLLPAAWDAAARADWARELAR